MDLCSGACTWGSCTPLAEACNGVDDDCNGLTDDATSCWRAIYRFRESSASPQARCWGTSSGTPPSRCSGYVYEIEAFVVRTTNVPGTFRAVQCSRLSDHIIVEAGSSEHVTLSASGYDCSLEMGYIYRVGSEPTSGIPYGRSACRLWRYRYTTGGGTGAHFFTRGADSVAGMTCEPPARGVVFTSFLPCFGSTAPGC